ncbi:carbon-nitrogen hydrolase family protein [Chondromyces crocatus]|uniref:Beta-alanine synthetase n=1 Tax=Chondromyces crocatus TaxID=52 RepID=A0A0K1EGW4_CHOCO|nr:carbon-nitrogen hydrolase family protein [Chondromyces crocatus]AKT39937.1 beta-alanine synthetase [Chondromyces crocatus]
MTVGVVQLPYRSGEAAGGLAALEALLEAGELRGVELALLPEAALTGYVSPEGDFDLRRHAETMSGPTARALASMARTFGLALAAPLIEEADGRFYNTLALWDREGQRIGHWRKRHPWFPERWATPGDLGSPVVEVLGLRVTAAICFDIHFVSEDAGAALDAADVLLFPSAWVEGSARVDLRGKLLPAVARRHGVAVMNANWGPPEGGSLWAVAGQGGSRILDAGGRVLARVRPGAGSIVARARVQGSEASSGRR